MNSKVLALIVLVAAVLIIGLVTNTTQRIPTETVVSNNDLSPKPSRVKIEKIGVDASVVNLGLNADKSLEVPKAVETVGWYTGSPSPGDRGPAVLVGHLDSVSGPAVFSRLGELQAGDMVEIEREDGSLTVFKIDSTEQYSQDDFPTQKVYGAIPHAGIRLITCSGKYNYFKGRYSQNLVVYGTLVKVN